MVMEKNLNIGKLKIIKYYFIHMDEKAIIAFLPDTLRSPFLHNSVFVDFYLCYDVFINCNINFCDSTVTFFYKLRLINCELKICYE